MQPKAHLHPQLRDELIRRPEVKKRLFLIHLITAFFFAAPPLYFGILEMGFLGVVEPGESESRLWWVLVFLAFSHIPVCCGIVWFHLRWMEATPSFSTAFGIGQTLLIIVLAFGEAIVVFGLIGVFLGATRNVQYLLMAFGVAFMLVGFGKVRSLVLDIVLHKLHEEEVSAD